MVDEENKFGWFGIPSAIRVTFIQSLEDIYYEEIRDALVYADFIKVGLCSNEISCRTRLILIKKLKEVEYETPESIFDKDALNLLHTVFGYVKDTIKRFSEERLYPDSKELKVFWTTIVSQIKKICYLLYNLKRITKTQVENTTAPVTD